jgi:hypothetical protein
MVPNVTTILQRFTTEWAALLQPEAILAACGEVGYIAWRHRVLVAACEQDTPGLQTWADVGQRFVRIPSPVGQCSSQMSQHSCANGLQTRLRANTYCEWHSGHEINAFIGTPCSAAV